MKNWNKAALVSFVEHSQEEIKTIIVGYLPNSVATLVFIWNAISKNQNSIIIWSFSFVEYFFELHKLQLLAPIYNLAFLHNNTWSNAF